MVAGGLIAATAIVIALGLDTRFQTALPGYTNALQAKVEGNAAAALHRKQLPTYGQAPDFRGVSLWLNSPPLSLAQLRGKVVLVDFWTYSCINCLRTLPHLEAWDAAYRRRGLVIVGVHTPEFAFEHVPANVAAAVRRYHVRYPVALDNDYGTWNAWHNQYWPAEFLVDKRGRVRHAHFGEGDYGGTENAIRQLLGEAGPRAAAVGDATPQEPTTPESYLGYARLARYTGSQIERDRVATYHLADVSTNELSYGGRWTVEAERIVAGPFARLRLGFRASNVYLVLGGRGTVTARIGNGAPRTISVDGDRLYTLRSGARQLVSTLDLRFTPGVAAYAFTFG